MDREQIERISKALGDQTRLMIYEAIAACDQINCSEIVSLRGITAATVSHHLRTLADFIAWCKANPRLASYGSPGAGTMLHFTGVMLARAAGFEFVHVPYQGARSVQDLLGGQVSAAITAFGTAISHVQSGRLRALVTTGPQRSPLLPDVPTLAEAGYPELEAVEWFGVMVPARTPPDIVTKLNSAMRQALKTSEVKAGLTTADQVITEGYQTLYDGQLITLSVQ